jgi:hypothetical protein
MTDQALAERALLTADELRAIIAAQPGLAVDADTWAAPLAAAMAKWGITSAPARAASRYPARRRAPFMAGARG